jgi:hypothetical protein
MGATEVNETQKWATCKERLRTTALDGAERSVSGPWLHTE